MQAVAAPLTTELAQPEGAGPVPDDVPAIGDGVFGQLVSALSETQVVAQPFDADLQTSSDGVSDKSVSIPADTALLKTPIAALQIQPKLDSGAGPLPELGTPAAVWAPSIPDANPAAKPGLAISAHFPVKAGVIETDGDGHMGLRRPIDPEVGKIAELSRAVSPVVREVPVVPVRRHVGLLKTQTSQSKAVQNTPDTHRGSIPNFATPKLDGEMNKQLTLQTAKANGQAAMQPATMTGARPEAAVQLHPIPGQAHMAADQALSPISSVQTEPHSATREIQPAQANPAAPLPQKGVLVENVRVTQADLSAAAQPSQITPVSLRDTAGDTVPIGADLKPAVPQPGTKVQHITKSETGSVHPNTRAPIRQDLSPMQTVQPSKTATKPDQVESTQNRTPIEVALNVSKAPMTAAWVPPVAQPSTTVLSAQRSASTLIVMGEGGGGEIGLRGGEVLQNRDLGSVRENLHVPLRPTLAPNVVTQIAEVARQLPNGPVEVSLSPEELGNVRLALSHGENSMTVQITAERPETLDLIRRHIDLLAGELRDQGFVDLSFEFQGGADQSDKPDFDQDHDDLLEDIVASGAPHGSSGLPSKGLDLRL